MSRLGVQALLAANRIFPSPALPGLPGGTTHADWQYATSGFLLDLWKEVGGSPPTSLLDVGCGSGGRTHRLAEATPGLERIVGVDLSMVHLRRAMDYHRSQGLERIVKVAADAARLPFADAAFDRVVCTDLLEHVGKPREMLRDFRRCLRPEGRFVLVFNPWGAPRGSHLTQVIRLPWCQLLFSRDTLEAAVVAQCRLDAARASTAEGRAAADALSRDMVDFFRNDVHTIRIADFRRWVREDGVWALEAERCYGPGPIRERGWLRNPLVEEWLTSSYGAILRPL